ncbi:MAG: caspase family protein [Planctomycetes bacterium]|nr:caspase family protein [Planctomycetota bacterium]
MINKGVADDDPAPPSAMDPQRKKRLLLAGSAFVASMIVCIILFMVPSGNKASAKPRLFVVKKIDDKARTLRVEDLDNNRKAVKFQVPKDALISLEHFGAPENILLDELKPGDRIEVSYVKDNDKSVMIIKAARPYRSKGRVVSVVKLDDDEFELTVALEEKYSHENLKLRIPKDLLIVKNENRKELEEIKDKRARTQRIRKNKISVNSVLVGDRVEVYHLSEAGKKTGRVISGVLFIYRSKNRFGRITAVASNGNVTVEFGKKGQSGEPDRVNLPVAPGCRISLQVKGVTRKDVKVNQLRKDGKDDYADVTYDTAFQKIHVYRDVKKIVGRIDAIRVKTEEIVVVPDQGNGQQQSFSRENSTSIKIAGDSARFRDLRRNDHVEILYFQSASTKRKMTAAISATRPSQRFRRAVLIGIGSFENGLPMISYSKNNIDLLKQTLSTRYAISADGDNPPLQILHDPIRSGVRGMKALISNALDASKSKSQIIIYISTHAFVVKGEVYLAGRNIDPKRIAETGMRLDWLLQVMEKCPSENKILLLDLCHEWLGENRQSQPSAAEMMKLAKTPLKSTNVIVSCSRGQRGQLHNDNIHSVFAFAIHQAYMGDGDGNQDLIITAVRELFPYLQSWMKLAKFPPGKNQLPLRFPEK